MKYFDTLPQILVNDKSGNSVIATNLIARNFFLPSLANNLDVMYKYDIKDGDTPENIAFRYYGSVDRFWLVLMANNILDAQWQWPLTSNQFQEFLVSKYAEAASSNDIGIVLGYVQGTIHHYEQDITTKNTQDNQSQTITIQIDQDTFDSSTNETTTAQFKNGIIVTKTTEYRAVSIYDYENNKNEANRRINILRDTYVNLAENQFKSLMK